MRGGVRSREPTGCRGGAVEIAWARVCRAGTEAGLPAVAALDAVGRSCVALERGKHEAKLLRQVIANDGSLRGARRLDLFEEAAKLGLDFVEVNHAARARRRRWLAADPKRATDPQARRTRPAPLSTTMPRTRPILFYARGAPIR